MREDFGAICLGWWLGLTDKSIGRSRADLARLRRAGSTVDVVVIRAVHDLNRRLTARGHDLRQWPERLVLVASTLAHVKENTGMRLAHWMGSGEQKALSEMRFERLIRTHNPAELATQLRRALVVVEQRANVARLAQDLRYWGDSTRATWCFDYYGAPQALPDSIKTSEEAEE